jgi:hypothetical protein
MKSKYTLDEETYIRGITHGIELSPKTIINIYTSHRVSTTMKILPLLLLLLYQKLPLRKNWHSAIGFYRDLCVLWSCCLGLLRVISHREPPYIICL